MSRWGTLAGLGLALALSGVALGEPDLVVTSLSLDPQAPRAGDRVTLGARVENVGSERADRSFSVRFVVDGVALESPSIPGGLDAGGAKTVSALWQAALGPHEIQVIADQPFDKISEASETNNQLVATVTVPINPATSPQLAELRVAVARFEDRSGSGFLDVAEGMADQLAGRLAASGLRVVERTELEATARAQGLDPSGAAGLVVAAEMAGADVLVLGTVTDLNLQQATLSIGFAGFRSATATVSAAAQLLDVHTGQSFGSVSASDQEQGAAPEWLDLGKLLTFLQGPPTAALCGGGLVVDRASYPPGDAVRVGYANPGPASWYWIEIDTFGGAFVRLLGGQFVSSGGCGMWTWDQRDALLLPVAPGTYVAKLWDGSSFVAATTFQIEPGILGGIPFGAITVGSMAFTDSLIGEATGTALNQLASGVLGALDSAASSLVVRSPVVASAEAMAPPAGGPRPLEGQVAGILPDGRVAINLGTEDGVAKGDFFQVLDIQNLVQDATSGALLSYDVLGVRGELVVSEVRERVSVAVRTTEFALAVGDVVRRTAP